MEKEDAPLPPSGGVSMTQAPLPTSAQQPQQRQQQRQVSPSYAPVSNNLPYSPPASSAAHSSQAASTPFTPVALKIGSDSAPLTANGAGPASAPSSASNSRQRSSIACLHCRRSKIRCVNTGIDTQCHACKNSGRECRYSVEIFKRSRVGEEEAERTPKRTKNRKIEGMSTVAVGEGLVSRTGKSETSSATGKQPGGTEREEGTTSLEDGILDPSILTPQVWMEVYEIFETHFGTDLPFLHSPTFSKGLRETANSQSVRKEVDDQRKTGNVSRSLDWETLMLGILTLTARLHSGLVSRWCSKKGNSKGTNALQASEHYARALRNVLAGSNGRFVLKPSLSKIQALLMLGLYEWSTCYGTEAWIHVGLAVRMAQAMGLQFEDDREFQPLALSSVARAEGLHLAVGGSKIGHEALNPSTNDAFIEEEMRRRTIWSCFIMDRYLSNGKFRPVMLSQDTVHAQLPCSQNAFLFGDRVCTEFINGRCSRGEMRTRRKSRDYKKWLRRYMPDGALEKSVKEEDGSRDVEDIDGLPIACESGPTESVLGLYVRMVDVWGQVARWSSSRGIWTDKHPPWHPESKFRQLRELLSRFQNTMPRLYRLSKNNIEAHIAQRTSSAYILLQILFSLSLISLHRELIPFLPLDHSAPDGPPLNHAQFFSNEQPYPSNFYSESAKELFKAVRDIADLVQTCHSRCVLPETPIAGFGLYMVAFLEVYSLHFPQMDTEGFVSGRVRDSTSVIGGVGPTIRIIGLIDAMRTKLPMAEVWFRTLNSLHVYYGKARRDHAAALQSVPATNGAVPTRNSGVLSTGPGAESLEALDKTFKDLGGLLSPEPDSRSSVVNHQDKLDASTNASLVPRSLPQEIPPRSSEGWATVNAVSGDSAHNAHAAGLRYAESAYATTQPPVLSRGTTPTPSAASMSPYPGPSSNGAGLGYGEDTERDRDRERGFAPSNAHPLQHQHGQGNGSAAGIGSSGGSSHLQANVTSAYARADQQPSQQQQQRLSYAHGLPSHASPTSSQYPTNTSTKPTSLLATVQTAQAPPDNGSARSQSQSNAYTTGQHKTLSGDDVAAFMDGISFQELFKGRVGAGEDDFETLATGVWSSVGAVEAKQEGWLGVVLG